MAKTADQKSRPLWKRLARVFFWGGTFWLVLAVALFAFQEKLVYLPLRELRGTPRGLGLDYEDIWFETNDRVKLHGWYIPAASTAPTMLYCHGNSGNISLGLPHIRLLHSLGLSLFSFDYRGYGQSRGIPSEYGTYADADAALNYLLHKRRIPKAQVIIYGRSLGGAVASHLAALRPTAGLIIESAFTSVPNAGRSIFPLFPAGYMAYNKYSTVDHVRTVRSPILVIHATDDPLIPFHHGVEIFNASPEPKRFLELLGGHSHAFEVSREAYIKALEAFIDDFIENRSRAAAESHVR